MRKALLLADSCFRELAPRTPHKPHSRIETISFPPSLTPRRDCIMAGKACFALDANYDILIMDADGQHLELESFKDLDTARRRLPAVAAQYPGTKIALWNRNTRA